MSRSITIPELTAIRSTSWIDAYLAIDIPATIWSGRVNQTFTAEQLQSVSQVIYDGGSGSQTVILPGMTLRVGSTAGGWDKGVCRIRKACTATLLYVGEHSEIQWANDLYLTVVDEFNLWAKHWQTPNDTTIYMDYDIAYVDENDNLTPVVCMGGDTCLWLDEGDAILSPTAAGSWILGSTISSYAWTAPGSSSTANLTTISPTIHYNTAGTYRIGCTITGANGKASTGYRKVFVYDTDHPPYKPVVNNLSGSYDGGGWNFQAVLYDSNLTTIPPRARCVLFAKDYYVDQGSDVGDEGSNIGTNVLAQGWVDTESLKIDPQGATVSFSCKGASYWLGQIYTFPMGLKKKTAPAKWDETATLTVDRVVHNLIHWRSTMDQVMDIQPTGNTQETTLLSAPASNLWGQLTSLVQPTLLAKPICNAQGQLFLGTDLQYLPLVNRDAFPVIMAVLGKDWQGNITILNRQTTQTALLTASGVGASSTQAWFSKAPGYTPTRYGQVKTIERLLISSQDEINNLAGMLLAKDNNPYNNLSINLAENNRMIDIAPRQYITLSVTTDDNQRGLVWTDKRLIPRRVSYQIDDGGALTTQVECEVESSGPAGITYIPPKPGKKNVVGGGGGGKPFGGGWSPPWIPYTTPPRIITPPVLPPNSACLTEDLPNGPYNLWMSGWLNNPLYYDGAFQRFSSTVRRAASGNKSQVEINGIFYKKVDGVWIETLDYDQFIFTATNESTGEVITAVNQAATTSKQRIAIFEPAANTVVNKYRIESVGTQYTTPAFTAETFGAPFSGHATGGVYTYESFVKETAPGGSTHYTMSVDYSGLSHVFWWPGNPNDGQINMNFTFKFAGAERSYLARADVVWTMVGGTRIWVPPGSNVEGTPSFISTASHYWQFGAGSVPATVVGDRLTGTWVAYNSGQYADECRIEIKHRMISGWSGFSGFCLANIWLSNNDGVEYMAAINSVYLRNVCP